MNRDVIRHLLAARHNLRDAVISLAPPRARKHLVIIDQEWRALITECLAEQSAPTEATAKPQGPRRIDIEE